MTLGKTATGSSLSNFLKRWFVFFAVMLCFAHLTSELLVESLAASLKTRAFSSFIYMLHQPTQAWEKRFLPVEEHELPTIHLAHTDTGDWMVYTGKRLFPVFSGDFLYSSRAVQSQTMNCAWHLYLVGRRSDVFAWHRVSVSGTINRKEMKRPCLFLGVGLFNLFTLYSTV